MQFEHFIIRSLKKQDLDIFFQLIDNNRPRLEAFFSGTVARTRSFEATESYLAEILTKAENKIYLPFIIIDTETNTVAGFVDIKNIDWNIPKGELGFFIDSNYQGLGLSKKAFKIFCNHCFAALGFNKLFLRTHHSNIAARHLAESAGFMIEGTLRKDYKTSEGELVDLLYYGKVSTD